MGWVIMGVVLFVLLNKQSHCRSRRRPGCRQRRRRSVPQQSVSDWYRQRAEAEDLSRRMYIAEQALSRDDERLRRDILNL